MIKKFNDFINEAKYEQDHELNRILDKISSNGIESITASEKAYLDGERTNDEQPQQRELIDQYGNYVDAKKSDFIFKVYDINKEHYSTTSFGISVFEKEGKYMVDQHIVDELFPELQAHGFEDIAEGELEYFGKLTKDEVIEKLKALGFNAMLTNRPII